MKIEITAQVVKDAYVKMDLTPVRKSWCMPDMNCACGLSAVYAAHTSKEALFALDRQTGKDTRNTIQEKLNISGEFMNGFVEGFDGWILTDKEYFEEYLKGFKVGQESWLLVSNDLKS